MSDTNTPPDLDALLKEKNELTTKLEGFQKELELAQKQSVEASEIMSSLAKNPIFSQELLTQALNEEAQLKQKLQESMKDQYPLAFQKAFEKDLTLFIPDQEAAFKKDFEKQFEDKFRIQAMKEEGARLDSITLAKQTNVGPRLPLNGQAMAQFKTQIAAAHEQHEFWGNQTKQLHTEAQKTQRDLLVLEGKINAPQEKNLQTTQQKPSLNEKEVADLREKLDEMERALAIDKAAFEKLDPQTAANEDLYRQLMPAKPGPHGNVSFTQEMSKIEATISDLKMGILLSQAELAQGFTDNTAARVEKMDKLAKALGGEIHWASRSMGEWSGHSVEDRLNQQIKGESHEAGRWKDEMGKVDEREQDLLARRGKLSSNVFSKVWNRSEISKIDKELNNSIPKQRAGLKEALDESEKAISKAQAGLEKLTEMRKQQDLQQGQEQQLNQHQKQAIDGHQLKNPQEISLPNSSPLGIQDLAKLTKPNVGETMHKSLHGHGDHGPGAKEVGVPQHQQGPGVHVKK